MIYTSYFAVMGKIPKSITKVSIARGTPTWYTGECYSKLAPKWETVMKAKNGCSWAEYTENYYKTVLDNLYQEEVYREIMELFGYGDIVLLCYEKRGCNCHRHIVAEWFEKAGIECAEYMF